MTRTYLVLGLGLAFAVVACGDEVTKNDAPPRLIEGGGAGDGSIDSVLNVHVVDERTDEVIEGATVYIGEAGEELLEAETDEDGLAAFDDPRLAGPTTITVQLDDYEVATWMGIDAANVTIPIDPLRGSQSFDQGTVSGALGWTDLPAPEAGHFYVAVMSYSQSEDLGADENEIEQPTGDPFSPNVCFAVAAAPEECNWSVDTRAGTIAVYASIIDIDSKGTEDDSDDTQEVLRFVYKLDLDVGDGETVDGVSLDTIDGADLVTAQLDLPRVPSGLDEGGAVVSLETDSSGLITVAFSPDATVDVSVPDLSGDFSGAAYRVAAFAAEDIQDEDSDDEPMSALLHRGITDLDGFDLGDYLPLATTLRESDDTYSFSPVSGSAFHAVSLVHTRADAFWSIAIFDGRTEFVLPEIRSDPRPSTDTDMTVDAFDGAIDVQDFAIDDFLDTFDRFSKARDTL